MGATLVAACFLGPACGGSGSGGDSSGGTGAQAGIPSSSGVGATGGAAAGNGGTTGGTGAAGASGPGGAIPDIDPDTLVTDLTDEQKAELCDWWVGLFGGYGMVTQCPVGSVATFPSQELCVTVGFTFGIQTVTVGALEACELSKVPSGGCDRSDPACDRVH